MEDLIIGFSYPKNVFCPIYACLISLIFKTKYSHSYVRFYSTKYNRWLIYESVGKGTRLISVEKWLKHAQIIEEYSLDVTSEQKTKVIQACIDNLGTDYSAKQAIGLGIKQLVKIFFKKDIKNPFRDENEDICSQASTDLLVALDLLQADSEEVTPLDLNNMIQNIGFRRI